MILVNEVLGTTSTIEIADLTVEYLSFEWFELNKRIQRKKTDKGTEVAIRLLQEGQRLRHQDVVFKDATKAVVVQLRPCEAIVLTPVNMLEMGTVCYEIGNKHMPLFIQGNEVIMPYEAPMFRWLEASNYRPVKVDRLLLEPLRSNVAPHGHDAGSSLFSKIMNLASSK